MLLLYYLCDVDVFVVIVLLGCSIVVNVMLCVVLDMLMCCSLLLCLFG